VFDLKKATLPLLLLTFSLLFLIGLSLFRVDAMTIKVKTGSSSADVKVDQLNHTVQIQNSGLVIVNDTLKLSLKGGNGILLQNFSLGFPFEYGSNLDYCFAYNASKPDERLEVELDVGLGGRIGFYGVNIIFLGPGLNISNGKSYDLTVVFVYSNLVSSETETSFNVTFPLYPSLAQNASLCRVTVVLPRDANYTDSSFHEKGLDFNITTLESFRYEPAWLTFNMTTGTFPLINVNEIKREIKLDQWGGLHLSDMYYITNKGFALASIRISLPKGASDVSARDEFGDLSITLQGNATTSTNVTISFRTALGKNSATEFTMTYNLPWKNHVNQHSWRDYNLTFTFFEQFDLTIRELVVTVTLPEGAEFQSSKPVDPQNIEKSVFQETVTFALFNVTQFQNLDFSLAYGYLVFWASFYPTLWLGVFIIIVGVIALLWQAPKAPPVPTIPVPLEDLRSFVEAYEGKTGILQELESMEQKLQKGRIPRRRYKVRRRMLEGRLSTLSRDLTSLREKIRKGGPRYTDIMRQIEVAETMLEGVETDIRRVEARYRRGEISKGAYGKILEEYHRRRERAITTIDGVLLRLREEIR